MNNVTINPLVLGLWSIAAAAGGALLGNVLEINVAGEAAIAGLLAIVIPVGIWAAKRGKI